MQMKLPRLACLAMMLAGSSYASVITMIHTGVADGTLGTDIFTNAAFTITEVGDTASRHSFGTVFYIDAISASIAISGVGTVDFLTGTRTFVNEDTSRVGFSRAGLTGADLIEGPSDGLLHTWDMLGSIGPIAGDILPLQWTLSPVNTSGGVLVLNSAGNGDRLGTFTATVGTPEPLSYWLIGAGILGIAILIELRHKGAPRV